MLQVLGWLWGVLLRLLGIRQDNNRLSLASMQQQMGDLRQELGKLTEASQRIFEVGKDLVDLQNLFRAPKVRGGLGEVLLIDLISQVVPSQQMEAQYRFADGKQVDAVVKLKGSLLPIDSKFPLENFRQMAHSTEETERQHHRRAFLRDVRGHLDTIAKSYIKPQEGTLPVAFMYIPAENIYYETIIKDDSEVGQSLLEYALSRQVIPVSPSSFYAYLQVIAMGLRGMQIEEHAQEVMARLVQLRRDLGHFQSDFDTLGKHLLNASNKYTEAVQKLGRLDQRLESVETPMGPTSLPPEEPDASG